MKKNKIIGVGIALLGTIISIGGAFALYQKTAHDTSFNFGAFTYTAQTGTITYKISNVITTYEANGTTDQSTQSLDPAHKVVYVKVPLSASYPTSGVVAQSTIGGNVSVSVTLSDAFAAAGVQMTTAAYMKGYADGRTYYTGNIFGSDQTLSSSSKVASGNKNIGVSTVAAANEPTLSGQYLEVYMNFSNLDDAKMLLVGGSNGYSIHVGWGERTDTVPYVVGDANNFTEVDEYQMVPVINEAIDFEKWCFLGLTGFTTMKVKDGGTWHGASSNGDNYGNVQISAENTYNVYFKHIDSAVDMYDMSIDGTFIRNII